jgi:alanyl-tRNA synthetase
MKMTSRETREAFLKYFEGRGHRVVRSSSLIPANDPTLLFTNAGMNQFKDVFTGREKRDNSRATTSQKCLRVSGKHNDLEQVGRTSRHHTFFEMLGNFSFGDYFKKEAIGYAWDLITVGYGLPIERLWLTVFGGSESFAPDTEAEELWKRQPGVDPSRVLRYGEKDNFWRMGDTGPCGPCSEIHYDHGPDIGCGRPECDPSCDCDRFVELWNLVFMQFEQRADGTVVGLPAPSIDTGMGLERISAVQQGYANNYDTDLFRPILDAVASAAGTEYRRDDATDVSLRVIADHLRAAAFLIADGVVPSNDKRGYVLRRVLRRAIRHGQLLGFKEPFLHRHVGKVAETMGGTYPELFESAGVIQTLVHREEEQFLRTLSIGTQTLEAEMEKRAAGGSADKVLPGDVAFRLYDTFGLPLDLTRDIAAERGFTVDETGFEREMEAQRTRARSSWKGGAAAREKKGAAHGFPKKLLKKNFAGYKASASERPIAVLGAPELPVKMEGARVLALTKRVNDPQPPIETDRLLAGEVGQVLLDRTPFYGESGGQVGDTGFLVGPDGSAEVTDTQVLTPGVNVLTVRVIEGALAIDQSLSAEVDARRRRATMRNHTATHLLHAALRDLVGTHVKQAGSLVAPDRLRFDFSHFQPLDGGAVREIEDLVNEKILEDIPLTSEVMPIDKAIRAGAMALFGEKYGEKVRVIRAGDFSVELCGGTHTSRTGEIGPFRLVSEKGISSGVRRVEALTGENAIRRMQDESDLLRRLEQTIGVPRPDLVEGVEKKLSQTRTLQKEIEGLRLKLAQGGGGTAAKEETAEANGATIVGRRVDGMSQAEMRSLADSLKQRIRSGVVILGRAEDSKVSLLVSVTGDLSPRVHAGNLVRRLAEMVGGGGGGRADMAEAGGRKPELLDEAIRTGVVEARETLLKAS